MIEPYRIKAARFYIDATAIGVAESGNYRISGNNEMHVTADEAVSFGIGVKTTELTVNTIVPVTGEGEALTQAVLKSDYVTVQVGLLDGKVHRVRMMPLEANFDTDPKTGMLKGQFRFQGGAPEVS